MKIQLISKVSASLLILGVLSSCADESLVDNDPAGGGGHTLTLSIAATIASIPETKATVRPARPGSEAAAAGFSYELVSSADAPDSTATSDAAPEAPAPDAPATKAATALKNVYALLFTSTGNFYGRANIGTIANVNTPVDIQFTVTSPVAAAATYRLVIVANDNSAVNPYTNNLSSFSGNYAAFQALAITSKAIATATDIPYAGSNTVTLTGDVIDPVEVYLYRTLASITLKNTFSMSDSKLTRASVSLHNAGSNRFAPADASFSYSGAATASTPDGNLLSTSLAPNATSGDNFYFYVGENIRPAGGSTITIPSDRNSTKAPAKASFLRITSSGASAVNTTPGIGQEYIPSGTKSFTYDIYLGTGIATNVKDFNLRRNTNYTITSSVTGTLATQEQLAAIDGRVSMLRPEPVGLNIGRFGGASSYTAGTGSAPTISGSYTKMLLLQPNTSGSTATDSERKKWSDNTTTQYQTETRKYWDKSYIYAINKDGRIGGMNTSTDYVYDYCYQLTLGGVSVGTWYVPTQTQLFAMWSVFRGLQENSAFANYSAFHANYYWSSSETNASSAWYVDFDNGDSSNHNKTYTYRVRCVRDL